MASGFSPPALVPAAELDRRFGGLERLYGVAGAARIRQAHVAVVGIGGVGSWAAEALARSGVGQITLVDMDHVAESNINRQIHALTDTVGQAKVVAMTCTHAALKRREFLQLAFQYDSLVMEESAQILEIETFIPMLLQASSTSIACHCIPSNGKEFSCFG